MKTVKNKQLVVGADFAGFPLKEAVVAHLKKKGWEITDLGVTAPDQDKENTDLMFHRVGLRVGACKEESRQGVLTIFLDFSLIGRDPVERRLRIIYLFVVLPESNGI